MPKWGRWAWDRAKPYLWPVVDLLRSLFGWRPIQPFRSFLNREVSGVVFMPSAGGDQRFAFKIEEKQDARLEVRIRIKLHLITGSKLYDPWVPASPDRPQTNLTLLDTKKEEWAQAVENIWSNKFFVDRVVPEGNTAADQNYYPCDRYSIHFYLEYVDFDYYTEYLEADGDAVWTYPNVDDGQHFDVGIRQLQGQATTGHLDLTSGPKTAAHEYGHWFGLDHDPGTSVMNGEQPEPLVLSHHYGPFALLLSQQTGHLYAVGPHS